MGLGVALSTTGAKVVVLGSDGVGKSSFIHSNATAVGNITYPLPQMTPSPLSSSSPSPSPSGFFLPFLFFVSAPFFSYFRNRTSFYYRNLFIQNTLVKLQLWDPPGDPKVRFFSISNCFEHFFNQQK